jgi:cell division septation protein DedD
MRVRALAVVFAGLTLYASGAGADEIPKRTYLPDLYRAAVEREVLVGHDARLLGLGSAGVALITSADGATWNPASLASVGGASVGVMDAALRASGRSRNGALSGVTPLSAVGLDMPGGVGAAAWMDGWGDDRGKQRSFVAGYGRALGSLLGGVSVRHERHYFGADTLAAWSVDVGLQARGSVGRDGSWGAGASINRLGPRLKDQRGLYAPRRFNPAGARVGGWYDPPTGPRVVTEFSYVGDESRAPRDRRRWRVGGEQFLLKDRLAVRAGYNSIANYDRIGNGLTSLGVSLYVEGASLDYAFVTGGDGLGGDFESRHFVSFTVALGMAVMGTRDSRPGPAPALTFALPGSVTPPPISVRNSAFSPNGDGVRDTFALDVGSDEPGARLHVLSRDGTTIATSPLGDRSVAEWDGRRADGSSALDGLYRWNFVSRGRVMRSGVVLLDATAPVLKLSATAVAKLSGARSPHGRLRITADEAGVVESWSLVVALDGDTVYERHGSGAVPTEVRAADMDSLREGGAYDATLTVTDEAGNESVASAEFGVLDLRAHISVSAAEGDAIYVEAPSTYFDAGDAGLSREGRDLVSALVRDDGLYVVVQAEADGLSGERGRSLSSALVAAGLARDHVATQANGEANASAARLVISRQPTGTTPSHAVSDAPRRFRVLTGSFRSRFNAETAGAALTSAGFTARVVAAELASGVWYRVTVGSFDTRDEAADLLERVGDHVTGDPVILTPTVP